MWGGSVFCILYKSVTPHIKLFGGYRLGYGSFRMDIPDSVLEEQDIDVLILGLLETSKDLPATWILNEILWGIDFLTLDNNEVIFTSDTKSSKPPSSVRPSTVGACGPMGWGFIRIMS